MAAPRCCSHRGGWKFDLPAALESVVASGKMLAGGGSGGVVSCHGCSGDVVALKGWEIRSQNTAENLLVFYSESRRFSSVFAHRIFCWCVMTSQQNTE
eukprot:scaffold74950_cov70-Cyclotella_meneghiniana.AAC.4